MGVHNTTSRDRTYGKEFECFFSVPCTRQLPVLLEKMDILFPAEDMENSEPEVGKSSQSSSSLLPIIFPAVTVNVPETDSRSVDALR